MIAEVIEEDVTPTDLVARTVALDAEETRLIEGVEIDVTVVAMVDTEAMVEAIAEAIAEAIVVAVEVMVVDAIEEMIATTDHIDIKDSIRIIHLSAHKRKKNGMMV